MEAHRARWRHLLKRLAFALIPLGLLLAGIEGGARLFVEPPSLAAGGPLGWTARPGLDEHLVEFGATPFHVSTNEHGLRTTLSTERSSTERWATFGDSTVFGWGLSPEETPAGVFERLVPDIEVLNAGQPGYSSEQSRRLAELVVPMYRPDRVVWFQSWHDVRPAQPDRDALPDQRLLMQRLLGWSSAWQHATRPASRDNPLFAFKAMDAAQGERVPRPHRQDNLERLAAVCASNGAELVLVLMPDEGLGNARLASELAAFSMDHGLVFIDMTKTPPPAPRDRITLPRDPTHLSAMGNALYMQMVLDAGLAPQP